MLVNAKLKTQHNGHTAGVAQACQPLIGLFKRPQTNRKDNEKGMQFGCQQPLLLGGALRDSPKNGCEGDYIHCCAAFFGLPSFFLANSLHQFIREN